MNDQNKIKKSFNNSLNIINKISDLTIISPLYRKTSFQNINTPVTSERAKKANPKMSQIH